MILMNEKAPVGEEFQSFLKSIGSLLAIQLHSLNTCVQSHTGELQSIQELTKRQVIIKNLLEKGFTNAQIAQEIGYSDSLVRQESIAIYSALQVSGRKDLIRLVANQSTKA
jgi:DNA-binding NarL/FixJ family response regulator